MAKSQAKSKQHPELNFHYFNIISIFHARYRPKIIGDILKMCKKQMLLFKLGYMINDKENEAEIKK